MLRTRAFVLLLLILVVFLMQSGSVIANLEAVQVMHNLTEASPLQLLKCMSVTKTTGPSASPSPVGQLTMVGMVTASIPQGVALWKAHRPEEARQVWMQVFKRDATNVSAGIWAGLGSLCLGLDSEAADVFNRLNDFDKFVPYIVVRSREEGDIALAHFWMRAGALLNVELTGLYEAAGLYNRVGRQVEAVALLRDYADTLPSDSAYRWRALGQAERLAGNPLKAIEYFERGLRVDPTNLWLLSQIRVAKIDAGDLKGALTVLMKEIELDGHQQFLRLVVAQIYRRQGDLTNARHWANLERQAFPNHWAAYDELGSIECAAGNYQMGLSQFDRALRLGSDSPRIAIHKAACLKAMGQVDVAIAYAEEIVARYSDHPDLIDLYLLLGSWYLETGDNVKACNLYRRGLTYWPQAYWLSEQLVKLSPQCLIGQ